jgi:hypothetical protein
MRAAIALAGLVLLLAGCSGDEPAEHGGHAAGGSHAGMEMGDPDATPAAKVTGGRHASGPFELLDTRPPGTDAVTGTAWIAHGAGIGSTVTVQLEGLPAGEYMAHVHAQPCASEAGGPHFRFDPTGPTVPPNEIHLAFTAQATGHGYMTARNDRDAGAGARSVVVHPVEAMDSRLACADLSGS